MLPIKSLTAGAAVGSEHPVSASSGPSSSSGLTLGAHRLIGFDLETTSADPWDARIVTASLEPEGMRGTTWLADPGVPIPDGAAAVHGITTEYAQAHGRPGPEVVAEVAENLRSQWNTGAAIVIYNAPYDLRVLTEEMRRHDLGPLVIGPVLDPLVLWRHSEKYRKGKKTLGDAVIRFGVQMGTAHESAADAQAAIGVLRGLDPLISWATWTIPYALEQQQQWNVGWANGFADWIRRQGGDWESIDGAWPLAGTARRAEKSE